MARVALGGKLVPCTLAGAAFAQVGLLPWVAEVLVTAQISVCFPMASFPQSSLAQSYSGQAAALILRAAEAN